MPDFINTSDLSIHQSVSEAESLPSFTAIAHADAVIWSGIPRKYRKWDGAIVSEMTAPEKATVDAAEATAIENAKLAELNQKNLLAAMLLTVLDQVNVIRAALVPPKAAITAQQFRDAVKNKYQSIS